MAWSAPLHLACCLLTPQLGTAPPSVGHWLTLYCPPASARWLYCLPASAGGQRSTGRQASIWVLPATLPPSAVPLPLALTGRCWPLRRLLAAAEQLASAGRLADNNRQLGFVEHLLAASAARHPPAGWLAGWQQQPLASWRLLAVTARHLLLTAVDQCIQRR